MLREPRVDMRCIKSQKKTPGLAMMLVLAASTTFAADIQGTISSTLTITETSELVGNVTCTVTGAACIAFGAPGIALKLNGFAITGQADPVTGCAGGAVAGEHGILINGLRGAVIQGPGIVQRFRAQGIIITGASSRVLVSRVTTATNCNAGIIVTGASTDNDLEANTSVSNGNSSAACGGICLTGGSSRNRVALNRLSGNGYAAQATNFGIGLVGPGTNDNVIVDNVVFGNSNGIVLVPGVEGNVVLRNFVVGNPPVQVPVSNPGTVGMDIRNLATPGINLLDGNVCLTSTNAACAIADPAPQR
jgi:parallel beta-helix repeat protein